MSAVFTERDLLRRAVLTVRVVRPVRHRVPFWLGLRCVGIGCRLMGLGGIAVVVDGEAP